MTKAAAFAQTFGARIRQARRSREMSQGVVAEALGVSRQAFAAYEHGRVLLPSDRVPALCAMLGITPNELFREACRPIPAKQDLLATP